MSPLSEELCYEDLQAEPQRDALQAVVSELVGDGATLVGVDLLTGGIENGSHRLTVRAANGSSRCYVLRRYSHREGGSDADSATARSLLEWNLLAVLSAAGAPVNSPRWLDSTGEVLGSPALIYDFVAGRALQPAEESDYWTPGAAAALHSIHTLPVSANQVPDLPIDDDFSRIARQSTPEQRFVDHRLGLCLLESIRAAFRSLVEEPRTVIHTDYWAGNTIWDGGRLQAIIDWDHARLGDPALDVGYMWMDLSIIGRRQIAERFVADYTRIAGREPANLGAYKLLALSRPLPDPAVWFPGWEERRLDEVRRCLGALIEELTAQWR